MSRHPVVIVGAGPAGLSAAIAMSVTGLKPLVIDENPQIGGQIYRQPPNKFRNEPAPAQLASPKEGAELLSRFQGLGDRVEQLLGATVWGIFPPKQLAVVHDDRSQMIGAEHIILAPGAYEYLPPFPGWTLPGVMTPGAAQALVKVMHVRPGKWALLAGTGPFLLVVADQLVRAGMEVAGIVEMSRARETLRVLPGLLAQPGLFFQGLRYLYRLKRAGVPIYRGHVLTEARGDGEVREAVIAPCDAEGNPDTSRARVLEVDTICAGYGFVPRIQLPQLAGCRLRFEDALGGWVPEVDEDLQTSVPGIWVAGDGGGVAGALVAQLEGALVGLAVARQLGAISEASFQEWKRPLARRLARLARFRKALDWLYRLRPGLTALAAPDTLVCRCEEVPRAEIEAGIAAGGTDLRTLKVMTRVGMGPCQGMMCWPALARFVAARTGKPIEQVGPLSVRPPIVPVSLDSLVDF